MAIVQLYVMLRDNVNAESAHKNDMMYKRGDVVSVFPASTVFSRHTREMRNILIVKVDISRAEANDLLAGTFVQNGSRQVYVRRREFKFNLDALPARVRSHTADNDTRTAVSVEINDAEMRAARERKPEWVDPNVIG